MGVALDEEEEYFGTQIAFIENTCYQVEQARSQGGDDRTGLDLLLHLQPP